jgi:hypothetical protein
MTGDRIVGVVEYKAREETQSKILGHVVEKNIV